MNEQKFANFSDVIISIGFFHKYLEIQSLRVQNPHNLPSYEISPRHLFVYIRANASSLLFLFSNLTLTFLQTKSTQKRRTPPRLKAGLDDLFCVCADTSAYRLKPFLMAYSAVVLCWNCTINWLVAILRGLAALISAGDPWARNGFFRVHRTRSPCPAPVRARLSFWVSRSCPDMSQKLGYIADRLHHVVGERGSFVVTDSQASTVMTSGRNLERSESCRRVRC